MPILPLSEPRIETKRLLLRPPVQEDFKAWSDFALDEEAARYIGGVAPPSMAWRAMAAVTGSFALLGFGMFSVVEKETGAWVGRVGPWMPEGWPGTEVGWGLARHVWGKGYATEAAQASIDWAFETLGWTEVIHCIHPDNAPSQKVAQRVGSRILRAGKLPAPLTMPIEVWGQTVEDWRARR